MPTSSNFTVDQPPTITYTMCMMNKDLQQLLKNEGLEVIEKGGKFYLFDLLAEKVDSVHTSEKKLEEYVDKNIFEYCS
jgi:hypothetical protein